jgi:formylmethanofuran dehydrogenase subunit E
MDFTRTLEAGELLHGHPCPPLALGLRAGALALERLGVVRARERELFAFVELAGDHYGQGFGDGVQIVTGCTFGKDNIARVPLGKLGLTLLDQRQRLGVRVSARGELVERLEASAWFRSSVVSGAPWADAAEPEAGEAIALVLAAPADALFAVSPPFPMAIEDAPPGFLTEPCDACGERVLAKYLGDLHGRRLCTRCGDRATALRRVAVGQR